MAGGVLLIEHRRNFCYTFFSRSKHCLLSHILFHRRFRGFAPMTPMTSHFVGVAQAQSASPLGLLPQKGDCVNEDIPKTIPSLRMRFCRLGIFKYVCITVLTP